MNKACALLLLAAGVTEAAPVVGQYGDGNVANDEWDATVVGGDMNTVSSKKILHFCCICTLFPQFFIASSMTHPFLARRPRGSMQQSAEAT